MPRPPDEPDDWDDVVGRVSDALSELGVVEGGDRDALMEGLREALSALGNVPIARVEVHTVELADEAPKRPAVQLVEGGRKTDEARDVASARPDLRLAAEDCSDPDSALEHHTEGLDADQEAALDALPSELARSLRVVRSGRRDSLGEPPGAILLAPQPAEPAWQTIAWGKRSRTYRLHCTQGSFSVHVDDTRVGHVLAGQMVDVEAAQLRVSAEEAAEGRYLRLRD